jgi:hypothetical protein
VLGQRRAHLHDFPLFMAAVLGLAAVVVGVFVATAAAVPRGGEPPPGADPSRAD